jgi:hypothetical protein
MTGIARLAGRRRKRAYGLAPGRLSRRALPVRPHFPYHRAMRESDAAREKRLAQALRDNLRRRKAQARASQPAEREDPEGSHEPE